MEISEKSKATIKRLDENVNLAAIQREQYLRGVADTLNIDLNKFLFNFDKMEFEKKKPADHPALHIKDLEEKINKMEDKK